MYIIGIAVCGLALVPAVVVIIHAAVKACLARRVRQERAIKATAEITTAEVHAVLVGARNSLVETGWSSGWGGCTMRHIANAVGHGEDQRLQAYYHEITDYPIGIACARSMRFIDPLHTIAWNDKRDRTQEDVLARFDKAIKATAPPPADPLAGVTIEPEHTRELVNT